MSKIGNFIKHTLVGAGVGAVVGFTIGGPIGATMGAIGGAATGAASSAAKMQGGNAKMFGLIGGAATGFMIGGPFGAAIGAGIGYFGGKAISGMNQPQQYPPQQSQYYPPMMPGYGYGMPNMGYGMPNMGYGNMNMGMNMQMSPYGMNMNMYMYGGNQMQMNMGMYPQGQMQMNGWGMGQPVQGGQLQQEAAGKPISYTTSGGYKVNINGHTITVTDPSGKNTVKHWGDPHEQVNGKTIKDWEDKTRSLVLGDGTKITMNADGPQGVVRNMNIYDGAQAININNDKNQITGVSFNPMQSAMQELYQPDGETAYLGYNKAGEFTYTNMYTQDQNLNVKQNYKVLAGSDKNFWSAPQQQFPPYYNMMPWYR